MTEKKLSRRQVMKKFFLQPGTTHTLVCIFLRGGADTLNMFPPYEDSTYYRLRPTLAIKPPAGADGDRAIAMGDNLGFHPRLAPLVPLYKDGRMAVVQAVGSDNESGSHFEAQDQIEHGDDRYHKNSGGWLARHLLSSPAGGRSPLAAVAMGNALPQSLRGYAASAIPSLAALHLNVPGGESLGFTSALSRLYGAELGILGQSGKATLALLQKMEKLHNSLLLRGPAVDYPQGELGRGLMQVAQLVKAGVGLEVATIDQGGWDSHFFQGAAQGAQAQNIDELARALAAFFKDLGASNDLTVLVYTEFGRRIYENGSLGTDHGRGFSAFALGAKIRGGRVHGSLPPLGEHNFELGPSGLPVLVDYRSVLAEIVGGVLNNRKLDFVFPHFEPATVGLVDCPRLI